MKKIIVFSTLLLITLAGTAFAGNLNNMEGGLVNLSNDVQGTYFSNAVGEAATDFVISTGHEQGGFVFGTGSFTTSIWRVASSDPFKTEDLVAKPSSWDATSAFSSWSEI